MDGPAADPGRLRESLGDLAFLNRFLGGSATILHEFGRLLRGIPVSRLSVLDVGAGGADILGSLAGWCDRRGLGFSGVAVDAGRLISDLALERHRATGGGRRVRAVCADGRLLPFSAGAFDVAICSTFLHHLEPEGAVAAIREMARVSELGVVASDLRRGWLGYLAARALAETVWRRHAYSRHDAPTSMLAAYSLGEARELTRRAGLVGARVEARPPFRWALRWSRVR